MKLHIKISSCYKPNICVSLTQTFPMESLGHLRVAVCVPLSPFPPSTVKKPSKPNAVSNGPISGNFSASKWANRLFSDFQFLPTTTNPDLPDLTATTPTPPYPPPLSATNGRYVSMPIDFYRVLGAEPHFLGDGIRRCYDARVLKPPQYGYSDDALISRKQILQAACETLADLTLRREYNLRLADDEFDTIVTDVPWENVIVLIFFSILFYISCVFLSADF